MVNPHPLVGNPSLGESPQPDPFSEQQNLILPALTQVLSPLGIRFKFSILRHPQTREQNIGDSELPLLQSADLLFQPLKYRLWVRCQAQKSLDYQIIATLLAKTLHSLDLQGFQDAIIESSQSAFPDTASIDTHVANWRLRIDLIAPAVRYQSWAQWGDVPSIVKLLNFALNRLHSLTRRSPSIPLSDYSTNSHLKVFKVQLFMGCRATHRQRIHLYGRTGSIYLH